MFSRAGWAKVHLSRKHTKGSIDRVISSRKAGGKVQAVAIDMSMANGLSFIVNRKRRSIDASILCEVPCQEGDEGSKIYNDEEWKTGNSRYMPHMWYQDVQNRKDLKQTLEYYAHQLGWVTQLQVPSLLITD